MMLHEASRWSRRTARMPAARIDRDTKMRPAKRRAQFDTTISPIIDPEGAVKQLYCAILCDLVRSCATLCEAGVCPRGGRQVLNRMLLDIAVLEEDEWIERAVA